MLKLLHCIHTLPQRWRPAKLVMSWKIKNNLIHTDVHDCQQTKAVEATTSNSNDHSAAHSRVFIPPRPPSNFTILTSPSPDMKLATPVAWRFQTARLSSNLHEFSLCKNCCWLEQAVNGKHCGHCKLDRYCIFISSRQSATRGYRPPTRRQPQQKTFYPDFTPFKAQVLFCIALSQFHCEITVSTPLRWIFKNAL